MNKRYGAIFDVDGVLVDNAEYHALAFEKWSEQMGIPFDPVEFRRSVFGKTNRDIFETLLGRKISEEELRVWADAKEAIYRQLLAPHLKEVPGLSAFLADLKSKGFAIGVATNGPPENAKLVIEGLGIAGFLDAVVTGADVTRGKPDPEVFLTAARRLGLPPSRCAVFEDSPSGAAAACAAGAVLIGVATGHPELPGASRMIRDFTEITAEEVMELIERKGGS